MPDFRHASARTTAPHPSDPSATGGYAICTTPRSGSNWLGQLLHSTGVLGRPLEYFNGFSRRLLDDPTYPDDPREQLTRILTMGKTPNGVYGLKMFAFQFRSVESHIRLSRDLPNLHFVFLRRRDILGQAISWTRASQTNQYRSTQPSAGSPTYDRDAIAERLRLIIDENALWHSYFARNGLAPVEITYEDMLDAPQIACHQIARLFGLEDRATIRTEGIDLAIQRDGLNDEWRRRFVSETADLDRL
jgi:LPS sulfotransferase NodH